jgi:hypothetical protein
MNPEQYPGSPQHNPYDFIVNPAQPKKTRLLPGGNNPLVKKLAVIVGCVIIVAIVLGVGASLLGGKKTNTAELFSLAQTQHEIVRVATLGVSRATDQSAKNLAINTELSVATQQQQLVDFLAKHGRGTKDKELALTQNAATDRQLMQAQQTSTFDLAFAQIMQNQIQAYASTIKHLHATSTSTSAKALLNTDYIQTQLLLSQVPAAQSLQAD